MPGYAMCHGFCVGCHCVFVFHPHFVPSLTINGQRLPVCSNCILSLNEARRAAGLDPFIPHPEAYEICPEEDL